MYPDPELVLFAVLCAEATAFFVSMPYSRKLGEARADARFAAEVYGSQGLSEPRGIRAAMRSAWKKYNDDIHERYWENHPEKRRRYEEQLQRAIEERDKRLKGLDR